MSNNSLKRKMILLAFKMDDEKCQSPYCHRIVTPPKDWTFEDSIIEVHSLDPPKHETPDHLITLCRTCHNKCEKGFHPLKGISIRTTGISHEINILEHIKKNSPNHFRWEEVLNNLKRKRKVTWQKENS